MPFLRSTRGPLADLGVFLVVVFLASLALAVPAWAQSGEFLKTPLVEDSQNPMEVDVAEDGRVFYIERFGDVRVWDPVTEEVETIGHVDAYTGFENGLMGLALAPDFSASDQLYLAYSLAPQATLKQRVSRFTLDAGGQLDLATEEVIYEWTHQRERCCHSAGALEFGPDGSLYISTGDNTDPFESGGYAPIDERPGREAFDAQRTSANSADPNGKILRIVPNEGEPGYTVPPGNLFEDDDPLTLPEIYAMGFRNPFRFKVDPETGWVVMGDYGPDANTADPNRGPQGSVEFNVITQPGNFGWPYCIRANTPYIDFAFPSGPPGLPFSCDNPLNESPNNTGLTQLPSAVPATMWLGYSETDDRFPGLGTGGAPVGGPIYHYDPDNPSETKFPEEYDGKWFIGEWNENWIKTATLDDHGEAVSVESFPSFDYRRPMDMTFGPDGALYLVEWGSGFNSDGSGNADSGIYRIDWVRTIAPQVTATADPRRGPAPLEVGFDGEATNPDGSPNPSFEYEWDFGDGSPTVSEEDPTHVYEEPGIYEATLSVTDPDTSQQGTATVRVRADACPVQPSDEFDGTELDRSRWNAIVRENPDKLSVGNGELTITTEPGDIWRTDTDPPPNNLILQSADHVGEHWTIETKLSGTITSGYSQGGLIAYSDGDYYVKIDAVAGPDAGRINRIELRSEVAGSPQSPQPNADVPEGTTDIWLRLRKESTNYFGEYSFDGENWTVMGGSVSNPMAEPRFGVFAIGVEESGDEVSFDHFRVNGQPGGEAECACVIPSDAFDGSELDRKRWNNVVREDPSLYRVEDGTLWVETTAGDIYRTADPAETRNFILQYGDRAGENWVIETKVLAGDLTGGYAQGGLIAYLNDDNYVKIDAVADPDADAINRIELRSEMGGTIQGSQPNADLPEGVTDVWLRLRKQGPIYSGQYSTDGENWSGLSDAVYNIVQEPAFGIFTLGVDEPGPEVGFDYFEFDGDLDCPFQNEPPAVDEVTADPVKGLAPLEVDFAVEVTDADGDELTYEWDFGEGGTSTLRNPTHTYVEAGIHEAQVTVSDGVSERTGRVTIEVLPADDPEARFRALVFSKTMDFRHDSIPAGHDAIDDLAEAHDFQVDHTEDATLFVPEILGRYDTVVFLSTTGDVLNGAQQGAFEDYIRGGGGFVGIHAAADTEYLWPWYGRLVGAYFMSHPPGTADADVVIEDQEHPSTASLPGRYTRADEWYNFESPNHGGTADQDYSPRGDVHVLASVDEETYDEQDGTPEADDHPITWCQRYDGGRSWYTAMGHTAESYSEEHFLTQLLGGLETTAGVKPSAACGSAPGADTEPPLTTAELGPKNPGPGGTYDRPVQVTLSASDGDRDGHTPETHDVDAVGLEWDPNEVEIRVGDEVRWNFPEETSSANHDVWLIPPGGEASDAFQVTDGVAAPGSPSVSRTLDEPGRWTMFCSLHPGMDGTIDVSPAPPPASGVDYTEYRITTDNVPGEWVRVDNESDAEPFSTSFTVEDEGEHVIQFRSADEAGNQGGVRSVSFTVVSPLPCVELSDEFDGGLVHPKWNFRHPTSAAPSVSSGTLAYALAPGELDEGDAGPIAFIGQPIPDGDFEIVARFSGNLRDDDTGDNGYAQAGLMLYQTDDNFVKVTHTRAGESHPNTGQTYFEAGAERDGVIARSGQVGISPSNPFAWWLRIVRAGDELTAWYATSDPELGGPWAEITVPTGMELSTIMPSANGPIYMGLYGGNGSTLVDVRYFRVTPDVVCNTPPVIESLSADPTSGEAPLEVTFSVNATDAEDDELTYEWDFGDGETSFQQNPTHAYAEPGEYEVTVAVSDGIEEVSDTLTIEVVEPPPNTPPVIESLSADPTSGEAPLEVTFSVNATDAEDDELTYEWDFGDGETSDAEDPTHTYAEPGAYEAAVTVSDGTDEVTDSVAIEVVEAPAGEPRLTLKVKPKSRKVPKRKRQVGYRLVVRNTGEADAGKVKICVKTRKQRLAVKGKACRAVSMPAGKRHVHRVKLRVKRRARGKRTTVKFVIRGKAIRRQVATVRLKVRR